MQLLKSKICILLITFLVDYSSAAEKKCEYSAHPDDLTQEEFSSQLTDSCRYDRLRKPITRGPLNITMQMDVRHIETLPEMQFKMHLLMQWSYTDPRLAYSGISPRRKLVIGEDELLNKIWTPHIVLDNERDSSIRGLDGKDMFVYISPHGEIIYSYRVAAVIYCWMDLRKFPFDEQICDLEFTSWTYNVSDLLLIWKHDSPARVTSQLHFPEFKLTKFWTSSSQEPFTFPRGPFKGHYSKLLFSFQIQREIGFYMMDYFLPSGMLVLASWVSFWLQADDAAPRMMLGTSTMLSLITLASWRSKNLPKVSYIKANDIWFLGCAMFIFASIAEFALVNIIWKRKKSVELKKADGKNILKRTFVPKLAKKEMERENNTVGYKSYSIGNLSAVWETGSESDNFAYMGSPKLGESARYLSSRRRRPSDSGTEDSMNWDVMTTQQIAIWLDKRCRVAFPLSFLFFNAIYWIFVYFV